MKKNLEHSALPTAQEIRLYQEGKLDDARAHQIELIAQENPLLGEAIEGFASKPSYAVLPVITAAVAQTAAAGATAAGVGGSITAAVKISSPWWHLNGWLIGAVAGTGAAVGTYTYIDHQNEKYKKETLAEVSGQQSTNPISEANQDTVAYYQEPITPVLTEEDLSQSGDAANKQEMPERGVESANTNTSPVAIKSKSASIDNKSTAPDLAATTSEAPKQLTSSTVAIKIIHVLDYEIADYTPIRSAEWDGLTGADFNVPARFASMAERDKYRKENPEKVVLYTEYIEQCLKAFDQKKYQQALDAFAVVLEQYRDDVNAIFYSAMSKYHLGQYEESIEFYKRTIRNVINTFDEEAYFYHGKALKELGKIDDANSMFVKVVQMNGFYREHALQEMQ